MRKRAMAIHMIYPSLDHLEVMVYSASGYNKGKDMLKSSFHLVWPQIIVDPDRAPVIRYATLGVFARETAKRESFLYDLQRTFLRLHESNNWELVFDNTTIHARNGLRLPYSDKASMVIDKPEDKQAVKEGRLSKNKAFKRRVREDRPSRAVGIIRFEFEKDGETGEDVITSARWTHDAESHSIAEWIQLGTCRRDPNSCPELTPWQLGPDVLEMLPVKPGEMFLHEGEYDGEGGHWVTHKPFPNIRRYHQDTWDFQRQFNEAIADEQSALEEEKKDWVLKHCVGTWRSVTDKQAIWVTHSTNQCPLKSLHGLQSDSVVRQLEGSRRRYATDRSTFSMQRPAEVVYIRSKGKVIVDAPPEVMEAIIRALKTFTRTDDNAVMPIYDLNKISKPPAA